MLQELCKNLWGNKDEKEDVDSVHKALSEGTNHVKSQLQGKTGNAESLTGNEETKIPSRWGTGEVSLKDKQEWSRRDKDRVSEVAACTEAGNTQGLNGAVKGKSTCYLGED